MARRKIEEYIYKIDNFLGKNLCDQAVEEMKMVKFEEHKFYDPIKDRYHTRSGSQELSMSWDNVPVRDIIMKKIYTGIQAYINYFDMPYFNHWQGYTDIRFNEYKENKKMALHCDHIRSMFDGERKGIPILSVLGALNDNFEGGEFIMFDDYEIPFKKGDLMIFPSNFLYPHRVEPVKKGIRYTYISWVW